MRYSIGSSAPESLYDLATVLGMALDSICIDRTSEVYRTLNDCLASLYDGIRFPLTVDLSAPDERSV